MTVLNEKARRIILRAEAEIGSPYVFGALGELCTPQGRRRRQRSDHPTIRTACPVLSGTAKTCEGCKWLGRRMYDCRGFTWWLLKQEDIAISSVGATTQYNTAADWQQRGEIGNMPDVVCCVFVRHGSKMSHTGLHIGGGQVIDCSTGVTRKTIKGFTHYAIPRGLYTEAELAEAGKVEMPMIYRRGATGDGVRELQEQLAALGYDPGPADGVYGDMTIEAVRCFQEDHSLTADGVAGPLTLAALSTELPQEEPEEPAPSPEEGGGLEDVRVWISAEGLHIHADGVTLTLPVELARTVWEKCSGVFDGEKVED